MKQITIKIDPGARVNTISLSGYQKIFHHNIEKTGYPKPSTLNLANHSWISHDSKPKPFLDQFITDVRNVSQPRSY